MLIFSYQLRHISVGKYNMGKRVKAVKPGLERYAGLVEQIKDKSKERKALLAEKKETPLNFGTSRRTSPEIVVSLRL